MAIRTHITTRTVARRAVPNFKPGRSPWRLSPLPTISPADGANRLTGEQADALHHIAEEGDLLIVDGRAWLLVPASNSLLDVLAAIGAEDAEPDSDGEPDDDREQPDHFEAHFQPVLSQRRAA